MPELATSSPAAQSSPAPSGLRTGSLFAALVTGTFAVSIFTNRIVMTDEVYAVLVAGTGGSPSQVDALISGFRRWETLGYFFIPLLLALRIGLAALLVQLILLLTGREIRLARLFRGALIAHMAVWAGTVVQAAWLAAIPRGALTPETMGRLPGSLAAAIPALEELRFGLPLLFQQVTVFDFGWIVLFAMAIEDGDRIRAGPALASVAFVWACFVLSRWSLVLYLNGMT